MRLRPQSARFLRAHLPGCARCLRGAVLRRLSSAVAVIVVLAACQPVPAPEPSPFTVSETILSPEAGPASPALTVTRTTMPLTRDDWAIAEAAAADHCAGQGAVFELFPATTAYTQVQYDEGVWTFVARCAHAS